MGNYPSNHIRIWTELSQIENESLRLGMVEKLINAPEYIKSMKQAGVYVDVITWVTAIRRGQWANWPKYTPVAAAGGQGQGQTSSLAKVAPAKRAMDYLHEAYDILGLSDDAALSPGLLKSAYYRKSKEHHPDKGGDPEIFDAMTKAYLYLSEVYNKLVPKGARPDVDGKSVTMEAAVKYRNDPSMAEYAAPSNDIELVVRDPSVASGVTRPVRAGAAPVSRGLPDGPPITLNPKSLNMNVFNQVFEQARLPDPEVDDGYGDWLKSQDVPPLGAATKAMKGKFNLSVFNNTFETASRESVAREERQLTRRDSPDALYLTPSAVVLGGEKPSEYTAPAGGAGLQYTDLKAAYSVRATFSHEVGDVAVGKKTLAQAKAERENDPAPASQAELMATAAAAARASAAEKARQLRAAARDTDVAGHHARLKERLLIGEK
uniref:J domain-containing protein n=1 Tax=viral metagenome TaxID=1070528 RepID=A0A6C0DSN8_9ZZZZ